MSQTLLRGPALRYPALTDLRTALINALFGAGEQGAFYDPSDSATVFQERTGAAATTPAGADDPVGTILDLSGNGKHATAPSDAARPLRKTDGTYWWLAGDGVDDAISAFISVMQPWERISSVQFTDTEDRAFGDTAVAIAGQMYESFSRARIYSGSVLGNANTAVTLGQNYVIQERHDGANSRLRVNSNPVVIGNAGTIVPGGVTLLARRSGDLHSRAKIYAMVMVIAGLSEDLRTMCAQWVASKAGITL